MGIDEAVKNLIDALRKSEASKAAVAVAAEAERAARNNGVSVYLALEQAKEDLLAAVFETVIPAVAPPAEIPPPAPVQSPVVAG